MYYIYGLIDPRDNEIKYIGITNKPKVRLSQHRRADDKRDTKGRWVIELRNIGLKPDMIILFETGSISEASEKEFEYQELYNKDGKLLSKCARGRAYENLIKAQVAARERRKNAALAIVNNSLR